MPYLYSLLNCLVCMWYALPFVSYGVVLVATVNTIGAAFQLAYTAIFIAFADGKKRVSSTPPFPLSWIDYACLYQNTFVLPTSVTGCFLLQLKVSVLLAGVFCLFGLIMYVSMALFDQKPRQTFVGYLSVVSLICMFASPLSIIVSPCTTLFFFSHSGFRSSPAKFVYFVIFVVHRPSKRKNSCFIFQSQISCIIGSGHYAFSVDLTMFLDL